MTHMFLLGATGDDRAAWCIIIAAAIVLAIAAFISFRNDLREKRAEKAMWLDYLEASKEFYYRFIMARDLGSKLEDWGRGAIPKLVPIKDESLYDTVMRWHDLIRKQMSQTEVDAILTKLAINVANKSGDAIAAAKALDHGSGGYFEQLARVQTTQAASLAAYNEFVAMRELAAKVPYGTCRLWKQYLTRDEHYTTFRTACGEVISLELTKKELRHLEEDPFAPADEFRLPHEAYAA